MNPTNQETQNQETQNQAPRLPDIEGAAPDHIDPFEVAFEQHRPELSALEPEQILHVNLELPTAITTALGVAKEVQPLRDQLAHLSGFDVRLFDDLRSYAQALSFANTLYMLASEPVEEIKPLYDHALALRETLNLDVRALVHRGLLDGKQIEDLSGSVGHKNVATDLQILGVLLRTHWADVEGKSGVSHSDIDEAVTLAYRLLVVIGEREQADVIVSAAADMRARAFTVFIRAYDDVRRAVNFIRWKDGDADQYVPALYPGRTKKKAAQTDVLKEKAEAALAASGASGTASPPAAAGAATPAATPSSTPSNQPYLT